MQPAETNFDPYAPWRIADFRRYVSCWFLMTFSKHIETLAVSVYFVDVYDASQSLLALGVMGLIQALPVMLLAIAGGQLADRFDRRQVMIVTLLLSVFSSAGLLTVALLNGPRFWIYLCLGVGAVGLALGSPSRAALLPQLVPATVFPRAVMWNSSMFYVAAVLGPIVGGAILGISAVEATPAAASPAAVNPAPAFALVFCCRLIAVLAISLVRRPQAGLVKETISWASVLAGIRFVWRTKLILAPITLDLFAVLLGGAPYLLPYFAKYILHVGPTELGLLRSADALGAICMVVLLAHRPPLRRAGVTLLWAVAGFGAAWAVFGLSRSFWLSLVMMFLVGALDNISVVVRHTLVQMLTPDYMRGRVSAVQGVFIVASNDLGGLESGLTAWLFGPVISVVGGGIAAILVVLIAMRIWPEILAIGSLGEIKPLPPNGPERATT